MNKKILCFILSVFLCITSFVPMAQATTDLDAVDIFTQKIWDTDFDEFDIDTATNDCKDSKGNVYLQKFWNTVSKIAETPVDVATHKKVMKLISGSDSYVAQINSNSVFTMSRTENEWKLEQDFLFEDTSSPLEYEIRYRPNENATNVRNKLFSVSKDGDLSLPSVATNIEKFNTYKKLSKNAWYTFTVILNTETDTYSLYINGSEITKNADLTNPIESFVDIHMRFLKASQEAGFCGVYIDNFSASVEYYDFSGINEPYDYVVVESDYESNGSFKFHDASGAGRLGVVEDSQKGKVAKTLGTTGSDYTIFSDRTLTENTIEDHFKLEVSLYVGENTGLAFRISGKDSKEGVPELFSIDSGAIYKPNGTKKTLMGWNDFIIYLDLNKDIYSVFINESPFIEETPLQRANSKIDLKDFYNTFFYIVGTGNNFYWDDVRYACHTPVNLLAKENILIEYLEDTAYISCEAQNATEDDILIIAKYAGDKMKDVVTAYGFKFHPDDKVRFMESVDVAKTERIKAFLWDGEKVTEPLMSSKKLYNPTDEDFIELKERYRISTYGSPETTDLNDPIIKEKIQSSNKTCKDIWSTMKKGENIEYLWDEYKFTCSNDIYRTYMRLHSMASAWATHGTDYYHNEELKNDIVFAMNWLYENKNGIAEVEGTGWRSVHDYDWWHWMVGAPEQMTHIFFAMGDTFTIEEIDKFFVVFDYLNRVSRVGMDRDYIETRAQNQFYIGILRHDYKAMRDISNCYKLLYEFQEEGTGLYSDYSYLAHANHPYTAGYGMPTRLVNALSITNGTKFELDDMYMETMTEYFVKGIAPLMHDSKFMALVCGRGPQDDDLWGIEAIKNALNLLMYANESQSKVLRVLIKSQISDENAEKMLKSVPMKNISLLWDILENEPETTVYTSNSFYNMDRFTNKRDNYAFGIAMSSERTSTYESVDQCNKDGWFTGDGMLYLYKTGEDQYSDDYWNYADPYKRPGTTEDTQGMLKESISGGYFPDRDFVGSVSLDGNGVAVMDFEAFHNETPPTDSDYSGYGGSFPLHDCSLTAKKSWFMFDNEAVCLGADITANDGYEVLTTIENRRKTNSSQTSVVENTLFSDTEQTKQAKWAHISGCSGYYFPYGDNISFKTVTNKNRTFFEMYKRHGISPEAQKYAYVLMPDLTKEQTESYALNPDIEILQNDSKIQSVYEKSTKSLGIIFWENGTLGNVTVSVPMIMMVAETDSEIKIVFSDPTHKLNAVSFSVNGNFKSAVCKQNITCTIGNSGATINADVSEDRGAGYEIILKK